MIFDKGRTQERNLCYPLDVKCRNLAEHGVKKYPAQLHDCLKEVLYFKDEFLWLVEESKLTMEWEANDKFDNLDMEWKRKQTIGLTALLNIKRKRGCKTTWNRHETNAGLDFALNMCIKKVK